MFYIAANSAIDKGYTASNRWECFLQAVHLIYLVTLNERRTGKRIDHLHAHFAHDPALIAFLVHSITGIPFTFTAHARDLFQVPEKVLTDRIRRAKAVITCCGSNLEYLNQIAPLQKSKFSLIYHGVNLKDFQPVSNPGNSAAEWSFDPIGRAIGGEKRISGFVAGVAHCQRERRSTSAVPFMEMARLASSWRSGSRNMV